MLFIDVLVAHDSDLYPLLINNGPSNQTNNSHEILYPSTKYHVNHIRSPSIPSNLYRNQYLLLSANFQGKIRMKACTNDLDRYHNIDRYTPPPETQGTQERSYYPTV